MVHWTLYSFHFLLKLSVCDLKIQIFNLCGTNFLHMSQSGFIFFSICITLYHLWNSLSPPIDLQHSSRYKWSLHICVGLCMGFLSCCIGLFVYTYTKNLIPQCLHYCSFRADLGLYKARHPLLSYSGSSSGRTWLFWTLRSPEQL